MFDTAMFMDASLLLAMVLALCGGLLSFLSPCVLPVVAPYLAYMGGTSVTALQDDRSARRSAMKSAFMFVLGLSTVFILLGLAAARIGIAFDVLQYQDWLVAIAGITVMIFGAHFLGIFRIPFLEQEARINAGDRGGSATGAYVLGLAFAFGWTPCLGPILGGILSLAGSQADYGKASVLMVLYVAGLGIPFLLVAAFYPSMTRVVAFMKRHTERVERISGLMLWTMGLMVLTGQFTAFANWLLTKFPVLATIG